jgi:hypothetical protein
MSRSNKGIETRLLYLFFIFNDVPESTIHGELHSPGRNWPLGWCEMGLKLRHPSGYWAIPYRGGKMAFVHRSGLYRVYECLSECAMPRYVPNVHGPRAEDCHRWRFLCYLMVSLYIQRHWEHVGHTHIPRNRFFWVFEPNKNGIDRSDFEISTMAMLLGTQVHADWGVLSWKVYRASRHWLHHWLTYFTNNATFKWDTPENAISPTYADVTGDFASIWRLTWE